MDILSILQRLTDYRDAILRRWWLVALVTLLLTTLLVVNGMLRPTFYSALTVFHPETTGEGFSAETSAISMILGGGQEKGPASFMIGVLKSRHISEAVAADSVEYHGQKRLVADLVIESTPKYGSLISWITSRFAAAPDTIPYRSKIINTGYNLRGSLKLEVRPDGFITMNFFCSDEELTGVLSREYIKQLDKYYLEKKTEKATRNVAFFSHRADSIKRELDKASYALARLQEQNRYGFLRQDEVLPGELLARQTMLQQLYVTLTISREQAMAQLQQDTPILQVLDEPDPPYEVVSGQIVLYMVIGVLGGIAVSVLVICYPLIRTDAQQLIQQFLLQQQQTPPSGAA
ncbi:MAG: hypothetical protein SF053_12885 [Bacteroidia bacterium]|nr:hypothetical protein [Bacteroidia bacterium]